MNKFIFSIIISIMAATAAAVYANSVSEDIANGVVRLHIIANSDSAEDLRIKYEVRDAIISAQKRGELHSVSDAADIACDIIMQNGLSYGAAAMRGKYFFPTKEYKNVRMPAGRYDAVRVVLGSGGGSNWWCVVFPPLCFTEECVGELSEDGARELRSYMSGESADILTSETAEFKVKFKIVETAQEFYAKHFTKKQ